MHGLAQVVARRGEETRLGGARLLGDELLAAQARDEVFVLEPQPHGFLELRAVAARLVGDGEQPAE